MNVSSFLLGFLVLIVIFYSISFFHKIQHGIKITPTNEMLSLCTSFIILIFFHLVASNNLNFYEEVIAAALISSVVTTLTFIKYGFVLEEKIDTSNQPIELPNEDNRMTEIEISEDSGSKNKDNNFWSLTFCAIAIGFSFILTVTLKLSFINFFLPFAFTACLVFGSLGLAIDVIKNRLYSSWMHIYPLILVDVFLLTLWNMDFGRLNFFKLLDQLIIYPEIIFESIGNWFAFFFISYIPTFFREPKFRFEIAVVWASIITKFIILYYFYKGLAQ